MSLENPKNQLKSDSARSGAVKFVHTADLHLDSPLRSLALRDSALSELVSNASRTALVRIVDLCLDHDVDALLIAGDLYDGDQKSMHTAAVLNSQFRRLQAANIPVFIILGNHDAQSSITKNMSLPENVTVFSARGSHELFANETAAVHGVSFGKKHMPESLLPKYKAALKDKINIGLMHTSLAGSGTHDVYAPCAISDLDNFGYDYWALGHIHKRSESKGTATVVMPGIPQGRDIGENGLKTVSLVSIDSDYTVVVEPVSVSTVQFELIEVDVAGVEEWQKLIDITEASLRTCRQTTNTEQLIVRVVLNGSTNLHFRLTRDYQLLVETVRESCLSMGDIWLDSVVNKTTTQSAAISDVIAMPELNSIVTEQVITSREIQQLALQEIHQLTSKLPSDIKDMFGNSEEEREAMVVELLKNGSISMLAQLGIDK